MAWEMENFFPFKFLQSQLLSIGKFSLDFDLQINLFIERLKIVIVYG